MRSLDDPVHVVQDMIEEPFTISGFQIFGNFVNVSSPAKSDSARKGEQRGVILEQQNPAWARSRLALLNTPETKRKAGFWARNGHLNIADWRIVLGYEPGNGGS
jgi:hypothetical protein